MIYLCYTGLLWILSWIENFTNIKKEGKKFIVIFISLTWVIMSSIRTIEAGDYFSYYRVFAYMLDESSLVNSLKEIPYGLLYVIIMFFCKTISNNYAVFNFVTYIIIAFLQYKVLNYWCDKIVGGTGYLITSYFLIWCLQFGSIFVIRQTFAVWICMYAYRFIEKKKMAKFIACIIIAAMFHPSALVFILGYIVYWSNTSFKKNLFYMIIITLIGVLLFDQIVQIAVLILPDNISNRLSAYIGAEATIGFSRNNILNYATIIAKGLANIGMQIFICYFIVKRVKEATIIKRYINIYLFSCVLYVSAIANIATLARLSTYFLYAQIPIMLFSLKIFNTKNNRFIWWSILTLYLIFRFTFNIYSEYSTYLPFTTIFN